MLTSWTYHPLKVQAKCKPWMGRLMQDEGAPPHDSFSPVCEMQNFICKFLALRKSLLPGPGVGVKWPSLQLIVVHCLVILDGKVYGGPRVGHA